MGKDLKKVISGPVSILCERRVSSRNTGRHPSSKVQDCRPLGAGSFCENLMPKQSAGILMFRTKRGGLQVLLVHPGGPFWAKKDDHAWSIPKGLLDKDEPALEAAIREFEEETGLRPSGHFVFLTPRKQPGGKWIHAWALEGDFDIAGLTSSTFSLEWPPGSGSRQEFPEVDRAAWFDLDEARKRIIPGQAGFLDDLAGVVRV